MVRRKNTMEIWEPIREDRENLLNGWSPMVYPVMQYPTYILDVEEVLADLSACYREAFSATFAEFGIPFDADRLGEYSATPLDVLFSRYYRGCTCKYRDFVTKYIGEFDRAFASGFSVREGVTGAVRKLHADGAKVCVVSDLFSGYVDTILSEAGIGDCIDVVFAAERMAIGRPDPYCIRTILQETDSDADTAVLVGTGALNEECARRAGIRFVRELPA